MNKFFVSNVFCKIHEFILDTVTLIYFMDLGPIFRGYSTFDKIDYTLNLSFLIDLKTTETMFVYNFVH